MAELIDVACDICGQRYRWRDDRLGDEETCRECGTKFEVVEYTPAAEDEVQAGSDNPLPWIKGACVAALIVAVLAGLGSLLFMRPTPETAAAAADSPAAPGAPAATGRSAVPIPTAVPAPRFQPGVPDASSKKQTDEAGAVPPTPPSGNLNDRLRIPVGPRGFGGRGFRPRLSPPTTAPAPDPKNDLPGSASSAPPRSR